MLWFVLGLGALLGSALRFIFQGKWDGDGFPLGTLFCNLFGCFLIGACGSWLRSGGELSKVFWSVGLLGSFTTFSAFSWQIVRLLAEKFYGVALSYWLVSSFGGIMACWAGLFLAQQIHDR